MADLPGKKTYHALVLRVEWKKPQCLTCIEDVIDSCQKAQLKEIPEGHEKKDFYVPFGWLNWKCHHEGSAFFGSSPVRSVYENQRVSSERG